MNHILYYICGFIIVLFLVWLFCKGWNCFIYKPGDIIIIRPKFRFKRSHYIRVEVLGIGLIGLTVQFPNEKPSFMLYITARKFERIPFKQVKLEKARKL